MMMIGDNDRVKIRLPRFGFVGFVFFLLIPISASGEKVEYAFPDDPGVVKEVGMMSILSDFREKMGWRSNIIERKDGSTLMVVSGIGTVSAPRKSPAFVGSRQNAYDKAMLDAKKELVELMGTNISGQIKSHYSEPSSARQQEKIEQRRSEGLAVEAAGNAARARANSMNKGAESEGERAEVNQGMRLVQQKVDQRLRELGYDPSKPVEEQALRKVTQEESFNKLVRATAKSRIVGLQPFKIFENYNEGEQGEVGVVAVWSPKLAATAKAIYSGDLSNIPRSEQGKAPFEEQVPDDKKVLLSTFGVRQVIGPDGEFGVLSFAQSAPRNMNRRSINSAYEKAKLNAMFNIRQFAGEVASVETVQSKTETAKSFSDGMESYQYDNSYQQTIRAKAKEINISGMRTVKYWDGVHPISDKPVAGAVVLWTPSGAQKSQAMQEKMEGSPSSSSKRKEQRTAEDPYKGEASGSSEKADMDAF